MSQVHAFPTFITINLVLFWQDIDKEISELKLSVNTRGRLVATEFLRQFIWKIVCIGKHRIEYFAIYYLVKEPKVYAVVGFKSMGVNAFVSWQLNNQTHIFRKALWTGFHLSLK